MTARPGFPGKNDESFLRQAAALGGRARQQGNRPFGALLVRGDTAEVVASAFNDVLATGDVTRHAEMNAVRLATPAVPHAVLRNCTLYCSAEPCVMCSGAVYLSGIGRVVFALAAADLAGLQGPASPVPSTGGISEVLKGLPGAPSIRYLDIGNESRSIHHGYWDTETMA